MKNTLLIILASGLLLSCQSQTKSHMAKPEMRHGWTIFSGPKATKMSQKSPEAIARGKKLYEAHCVKCHGTDGKGKGKQAQKMKIRPANLTQFSKTHGEYQLLVQVTEGKGAMPAWKDLFTPSETSDLSQYVRSLSKD